MCVRVLVFVCVRVFQCLCVCVFVFFVSDSVFVCVRACFVLMYVCVHTCFCLIVYVCVWGWRVRLMCALVFV